MKPLFGLQDSSDLKWLGDYKNFDFLELWKQTVESNSIQLSPKQLMEILIGKMEPSKVFAQDVS